MSIEVKGAKHKSIVGEKSYSFALEMIKLERSLRTKHEYILSNQIVRSGTSIGANVNEAQSAESKRDFVHKMNIALKEARETKYWLNLIHDSDQMGNLNFEKLEERCDEIIRMLTSIINTTRENIYRRNDG